MTACEFLRDNLVFNKTLLHTVMEKLYWWEGQAIIICYRPHWTKSDLLGKPLFLYSTNCLPVHSGPWQPSRCQSNYPLFTADLVVSFAIFFPFSDDWARSGWGGGTGGRWDSSEAEKTRVSVKCHMSTYCPRWGWGRRVEEGHLPFEAHCSGACKSDPGERQALLLMEFRKTHFTEPRLSR